MKRLAGKVALVTGAASGIGRATAARYAAEGARVVASDVDATRLEETVAEITRLGGAALARRPDIAASADVRELVAAAVEWAGALHIVANVAGIGQFDSTVETLEEDEWDRVLAVNLKSVYLVSKYAIPHLRAAGGGVILNVASPHAMATTEGVSAYAASKGGVVALSRQMAIDFARDNIRVVSVIPGAVDTPMLRAHAERQHTTLDALGFHSDQRTIGRIGTPEELANSLLWLASDEASFVNAAPIIVDGGLLARL
ncbi:MAG: SDR family NAD(P)-dependent oxidoreductase [Actinomycetota bacterium]